jgi:hypothetical protein
MSGKLMIFKEKNKKNNLVVENLNIKYLKKKMQKLNNELGFMSNFLFRLRFKINNRVKRDLAAKENSSTHASYCVESVPSRDRVYS